MSCPTGAEVKPFIDFLRAYSKRNKNLTAVDCLRRGISEWQCLQKVPVKQQLPIEEKRSRTATTRQIYLFRSLSRIFGKKHTK